MDDAQRAEREMLKVSDALSRVATLLDNDRAGASGPAGNGDREALAAVVREGRESAERVLEFLRTLRAGGCAGEGCAADPDGDPDGGPQWPPPGGWRRGEPGG